MKYDKGKIHDVVTEPLVVYADGRGSLVEMWRMDESRYGKSFMEPDGEQNDKVNLGKEYDGPVMSYLSWTKPGAVRGFHVHERQVDHFHFAGPGLFKVVLFDGRENSPSKGVLMEIFAGTNRPTYVKVPTMVFHGYKNVGLEMGLVVNFPDSLFAGWNKKFKIDEKRYDPHEAYFGYDWTDKDN